ncbi:MAG TPA: MFS transporter [Tepidisphaeraceae bacterium]|nr:MFS transporter [Tepidisphaeraceae bacterium]
MTSIAPNPLGETRRPPASPGAYAWAVVAMLWAVGMLNYFDRLLITTMRDPIRADISMTDAQFGLLTSMFLWVYAATSPLGGWVADRFNKSLVIAASLLFWSAAMYCTGFARNFPQLLLGRGLMGLSEACYLPAALAIICDYHRGPTRSFATGLHMSGITVGAALGGIGGILAEHFGWRAAFHGLGLAGVAYGIVVLCTLRDSKPRTNAPANPNGEVGQPNLGTALQSLFVDRAFLVLIAVNALVGMVNWAMYGWLPTYLEGHFRLGIGTAGLSATTYVQAAAFIGVFVGGWWADRWSRTNPLARRRTPGFTYILAGPCLLVTASTGMLAPAIAGLVVAGLARGVFDANHMPILREVADERFSATGFGILNLVSCVTGGLMVYAAGLALDTHIDLSRIFQVCAAALPVIGILLLLLGRSSARAAPGVPPSLLGRGERN